nr:peroxiredoxin [Candidatus Dependentiae bacterium]
DFSLQDAKGDTYTLSSFRGKKVALIFYPKPNTPGCTKQLCSLRDKFLDLQEAGIVVLGISKGSPEDMKQFAEAQHLSFPLLIADDEVLKKYHTQGDLLTFSLPKRYTFLIDEQGAIVSVITKIDLTNHAQQILQEFQQQKTLQNKNSL